MKIKDDTYHFWVSSPLLLSFLTFYKSQLLTKCWKSRKQNTNNFI